MFDCEYDMLDALDMLDLECEDTFEIRDMIDALEFDED